MRCHIYDPHGKTIETVLEARKNSTWTFPVLRNNAMREVSFEVYDYTLILYDSDFVFLEFMSFECGNSIRIEGS